MPAVDRRTAASLAGRCALRRLAIACVCLIALLIAAGPGPAVAAPFDKSDVFHLYVVDLRAIRDRPDDAARYINYRWRDLTGETLVQNGRVLLIDGVRGSGNSTIDLSTSDVKQADRVQMRLRQAVSGLSRSSPDGLELDQIGRSVRDTLQPHLDDAATTLRAEHLGGVHLVVIHLVANELMKTLGHGDPSLHSVRFTDGCFPTGVLSADIRGFSDRVGWDGAQAPPAIALRAVLVLVPTGPKRFAAEAERAAALSILGPAAFDGSAVVLRDGLSCVETEDVVRLDPVQAGACSPVRMSPPPERPQRNEQSCIAAAEAATLPRVTSIISTRINDRIFPLSRAPGHRHGAATPDAKEPILARTDPQSNPPPVPTTTQPSPSTTPVPPPVASPAPVRPTPAPQDGSAAKVAPPAPDTPSAPTAPSTAKPTPSAPPTTEPASRPTMPAVTPPPAPPTPRDAPHPPPVPPKPPSQPVPTAPTPAAPVKVPSTTAPTGARLEALAVHTPPQGSVDRRTNIVGRLSVTDGSVTVLLLPVGRTPKEMAPNEAMDVTHGNLLRPAQGVYNLVAQLGPGLHCDAGGGLHFFFRLEGSRVALDDAGEYAVDLSGACTAAERSVPFARVKIE